MKSDGEKSILNIVEAVQMMRDRRDEDTILEQFPKGESGSNGGAEQSNKELEGMIRTLKSSIEEIIGKSLDRQRVWKDPLGQKKQNWRTHRGVKS